MAEIAYGTVLKLIRIIERAGLDRDWPDFLRAYGLPEQLLEPERRPSAGYSRAEAIEERRMKRLKEVHRKANELAVKRLFESIIESVLAELDDPGRDHAGHRAEFFDDDEGALYDLNALKLELEEAGYRIERGRLVAEARVPGQPEIDAVTGIGNRAYLNQQAATVWEQCRTKGVPVATVFIDIDHFKKFNDDHGHATGDAVLRGVAQVIEKIIRLRGGVTGRYGGEEMVATMPNMVEAEAVALGERIRKDVERLRVKDLSVTVSVGVASSENRGESLQELWDMADRSLYRAKSTGRNKTGAYSELAG